MGIAFASRGSWAAHECSFVLEMCPIRVVVPHQLAVRHVPRMRAVSCPVKDALHKVNFAIDRAARTAGA